MISIRKEIADIDTGKVDRQNNLLKNAPHTHQLLIDEWVLPYSREQAFFPDIQEHDDKYWPPVGRVDSVYGDKNTFCCFPSQEISD